MVFGYARCSTNEDRQEIDRQIRELKAAGADEIVFEYEHGDAVQKQAQRAMLDRAKAGDTILCTEVSRLSRSTQQMCSIVAEIQEKQLRLKLLDSITIDCRSGEIDPMSRAFIQMAAVFSELELSMIRARVRSGLSNARAKGVKLGRPKTTMENIPSLFFKHYPQYKSGKLNISEFARVCGLTRVTIYKYLKIAEGEDAHGEDR